jgi:hypothetical protein
MPSPAVNHVKIPPMITVPIPIDHCINKFLLMIKEFDFFFIGAILLLLFGASIHNETSPRILITASFTYVCRDKDDKVTYY